MSELLAVVNEFIARREEGRAPFLYGEVLTYNPDAGTVTVMLQPYGVPTGDIPIFVPWAGSPGTASGAMGGPEPGTLAILGQFDPDDDHIVALAFGYSSKNKPPAVPSGEYWIAHKDGKSGVRVRNNSKTVVSGEKVTFGSTPDADFDANHDLVRKSDLQAVIDKLNALVSVFNSHVHLGPFVGPTAPTATPGTPSAAATASSVARAE